MTTKKTMFAGDSAFENMLKASSLDGENKTQSKKPIEQHNEQHRQPEKKATSTPRAKKQTEAKPQAEKSQLNLYIDPAIYTALGLRKLKAKSQKIETDKTFVGIVEAALALYLADEIHFIGTRGL